MKTLIMLVTLSLGAFVFAGDDTTPSVPNCPPGCGVKTDKKTDKNSNKNPIKKAKILLHL